MATCFKGQVFKGYLAMVPGVEGPIRWEYRGMWPALRTKYMKDLSACTSEEDQEILVLATMARMVVKWNLEYPKNHPDEKKRGQVVPIDANVIRDDVMVHVRNLIMAVSTWQKFSDPDPQDSVEDQEKAIQAKVSGKSAADMFSEVDAELVKN